jgi:hypothetical protein
MIFFPWVFGALKSCGRAEITNVLLCIGLEVLREDLFFELFLHQVQFLIHLSKFLDSHLRLFEEELFGLLDT